MVQLGVLVSWCGLVWPGVLVWPETCRLGLAWCLGVLMWPGAAWCGLVRPGVLVWPVVWCGLVFSLWCSLSSLVFSLWCLVWPGVSLVFGVAWCGLVYWCGLVRPGVLVWPEGALHNTCKRLKVFRSAAWLLLLLLCSTVKHVHACCSCRVRMMMAGTEQSL